MDRGALIFAIVTAAVALYGAVLSTYSVLSSRREKKRRVSVKLSGAVIAVPGDSPQSVLMIEATNPGDRSVTLQMGMIRLPQGDSIVPRLSQSNVGFPHELPEGKSCHCWIETSDVSRLLVQQGYQGSVKLVGFFRSSLGTEYRSKPMRFRIQQSAPQD